MMRLLWPGKGDGEGRAVGGRAIDGGGAAVGFDEGFDQAEAEADAALGAAFVAAKEAVPDEREIAGFDADAGVADGDADFVGGKSRADFDAASVGRVFEG